MEYEGFLSKGQYAALVIVAAISAFLSILGSIAITRIAYLKMTSTYQRFLFMLSLSNVLNSIFITFHQLMIPKSDAFFWALGNAGSCSTVGFFLHFGSLSVAMYSCFLSLYFYFTIQSSPKRQKQPEDIVGSWEWLAHLAAIFLPVGIAVVAAATGNIDVSEGLALCIIQNFDCKNGELNASECTLVGDDGWALPNDTNSLRWAYLASIIASASISVLTTILVYCKVQITLKNEDAGLSDEMKQRLRAVATQALLYTGVFATTIIWPLLAIAIPTDTKAPVYALHFLAYLLYPLQGVLNCLIYIRPRYQMLSTMYPNDSTMVVLRVSLSKAGDPDEIEEVRERIYGDKYEPPSVESSVHSLASDMPSEVKFDPTKALSASSSLVSVPADDDSMDPERPKDEEEKEKEAEDDAKST